MESNWGWACGGEVRDDGCGHAGPEGGPGSGFGAPRWRRTQLADEALAWWAAAQATAQRAEFAVAPPRLRPPDAGRHRGPLSAYREASAAPVLRWARESVSHRWPRGSDSVMTPQTHRTADVLDPKGFEQLPGGLRRMFSRRRHAAPRTAIALEEFAHLHPAPGQPGVHQRCDAAHRLRRRRVLRRQPARQPAR
jgi:hypothetical protein